MHDTLHFLCMGIFKKLGRWWNNYIFWLLPETLFSKHLMLNQNIVFNIQHFLI